MILSDRKTKLKRTYHRILLCMSLMDIFQSMAYVFATTPVPTGTPNFYGASGNRETCTAQGFFIVLGYSVPLYNVALSLYYILFTINKNSYRKLENCFHLICLGIPLCMGIGGVIGNEINNTGSICFFAVYPLDCLEDNSVECIRGLRANIYMYISGFIILFAFFIISTNMLLLFHVMHRQHQIMLKRHCGTGRCWHVRSSFRKKEERIARQALCYVFSFFITFVWALTDGVKKYYLP